MSTLSKIKKTAITMGALLISTVSYADPMVLMTTEMQRDIEQDQYFEAQRKYDFRENYKQNSRQDDMEIQRKNREFAESVVNKVQSHQVQKAANKTKAAAKHSTSKTVRTSAAVIAGVAMILSGRTVERKIGENTTLQFSTEIRTRNVHHAAIKSDIINASVTAGTQAPLSTSINKRIPGIDVDSQITYSPSKRKLNSTVSKNMGKGFSLSLQSAYLADNEQTVQVGYGIQF